MSIDTAIIPAAGFGTRFLPATKAVPKEMLPVVDRPMIEYSVAEAVAAGVRRIVVVVSEGKDAIRAHFAPTPALERALESAGKTDLLEAVRERSRMAEFEYVVQEEQLGLGHAVATARDLVKGEPFAVLLPDEVIVSDLMTRILAVHEQRSASVIGLMEVTPDEISAYGCPEAKAVADDLVEVVRIVEKPPRDEAPSNFATIGRYVFTPEILDALGQIEPGALGELQLTDAIDLLIEEQSVYGAVTRGGRFDAGRTLGMLEASLELALARDDLGDDVRALLADIARRHGLA